DLQRAHPCVFKVPDAPEVANDTTSTPAGMTSRVIVVLAAVIEQEGRFLLTRRLDHTRLGGLWEFPGGKCEAGESHDACLRRELAEELGVDAQIGDEIIETEHAYPERTVRLHFRRATILGTPQALL